MTHTATAWSESGMDSPGASTVRVAALNNLELTYDDAMYYMNNTFVHNIYTKTECNTNNKYYRTANHPSGRSDTGVGCGINAAYLSGKTLADIQAGSLPHGAIGMWGLGSIPGVLQECNGANGSPNMQNYFLRGASPNYPPGSTGGQNSLTPTANNFTSPGHSLTVDELPPHTHNVDDMDNSVGLVGTLISNGINHELHTANTTSTNGYENGTSDIHNHDNCTFTWTGYKDEDGNSHSGVLDNRPPYIVVRFVMVK